MMYDAGAEAVGTAYEAGALTDPVAEADPEVAVASMDVAGLTVVAVAVPMTAEVVSEPDGTTTELVAADGTAYDAGAEATGAEATGVEVASVAWLTGATPVAAPEQAAVWVKVWWWCLVTVSVSV